MIASFQPSPNREAAALLRSKPAVSRSVFDGMLPELRARTFVITGLDALHVVERIREEIAGIAEGERWDDAKARIVDNLEPFLGEEEAVRRGELLLRTHGFQAFNSGMFQAAQDDEDTTHLQYLTMEDERVRPGHAALNGIVLPKDDPFWETHTPPWDWGCRCSVRPMNPDLVDLERAADAERNPEDRNVMEGAVAEQLRQGTLMRGTRRFDVTAPSERMDGQDAFQWNPRTLRLDVKELEARHDPETWESFVEWAKATPLSDTVSVWDWLERGQL